MISCLLSQPIVGRSVILRVTGFLVRGGFAEKSGLIFSVTIVCSSASNAAIGFAKQQTEHLLARRKRHDETPASLLLSCRRKDLLSAVAVSACCAPLLGLAVCPDRLGKDAQHRKNHQLLHEP